MSRIFMTGCEHGNIYAFNVYSIPGGATFTATTMMNTSNERTGDYCLMTGDDTTEACAGHALAEPSIETYIRCYIQVESGADTDRPVLCITDDLGKKQVYYDISGKCYHWDGAAWALLGTASAVIPQDDAWHLLEFRVRISQSPIYYDGIFTAKLDGVEVLDLTSANVLGGDFGTDFTTGQVIFGNWWSTVGGNTGKTYFDDMAINDTEGSYQNSWIGAGAIYAIKPNGIGDYEEMTPFPNSGESNYEDVDEVPPDDDTSYVQPSASLQKDLYEMSDLCDQGVGSLAAVSAVVIWYRVKLTASGSGSFVPLYKYNGTLLHEFDAETVTSTDYVYKSVVTDEDPVTGGTWLVDYIDLAQFGLKEGS